MVATERQRVYREYAMTIGANITAARLKAGLSQAELARATGFSAARISDLEADRYKNPRLPTLRVLAVVLGCSVEDLQRGVDAKYDDATGGNPQFEEALDRYTNSVQSVISVAHRFVQKRHRINEAMDVVISLRSILDAQADLAESARENGGTPSALALDEYERKLRLLEPALKEAAETLSTHLPELDDIQSPVSEVDVIDLDSPHIKNSLPVLYEGEASPEGLSWDESGTPRFHVEEWGSRPMDIKDPQAYLVIVRGDSMEPYIKRGYRAIVSPNLPVGDGDLVCAHLRTGERLIKEARRDRTQGGWQLQSWNPAYAARFAPDADLSMIHKVAYVRTMK